MLIEEPEVLKQWLTTHLEPLCDADPAALAKYVLALIKKEKTKDELKESMVQQMDVFLQTETNSFIELLFKVVESKEYLDSGNVEKEVIDAKAGQLSQAKAELEAVEAKIEAAADSTTPQREEKYITEERSRKFRAGSPGRDRRLASRLGPRETHRRFRSRSRSRSLSPRYERVRSRRRSRSPPPGYIDRRRRSLEFILRRGRSLERARYKVTSRDSTPTRDEAGYTPTAIVKSKRPRCRDYDIKGFCLKGDLCHFDHGVDAVVLEDAAKAINAPAYQPTDPYVPGLPRVAAGIPYPPPASAISVPPPGFPGIVGKRSFDGSGYEPPTKMGRGRGRGGRGGRGGGRGGLGGNMLAVRNIPAAFNTITHLNGHFSRYGALQNVQVQFEGDPSSALITFHSTEEAAMAFNSSEAVMNNRFIKMFWHSDKGNVKNRLGGAGFGPGKFSKTISNDLNHEEMDPEKVKELKDKEMIAVKKNQEMLQAKNELLKKAEEKRKAAMAQQGGILKSKRDLLDGLIEQQKALIVKIEKGKGTMKQEEKTKVMSLLKELSNSIDKTKEDIKNMISISGLKKRSKAEVQKELLDAEMELFTAQHDGGPELQQIQQKVNSLKIEAARAGILPTSKAPRGRGKIARGRGRGGVTSVRGRGRGGARGGRGGGVAGAELGGANRLDRRPGSVMVTGYAEDTDREELVGHFRKFGEIVEVIDQEDASIIIKFKQIRSAQTAINTGKTFGESTLGLSWCNTETTQSGEMPRTEESNDDEDGETPYQEDYLPAGLHEAEAGNGEEAETTVEEINEKLLDDEEEEVVEDERSWKRRANDED